MEGKHFSEKELSCPHCGQCKVTQRLVDALDALRELAGVAIVVHDAYRCAQHNLAVGGVPKSEHPNGEAADIVIEGKTLNEMYALAEQIAEFNEGGIGVYDGKPFIHVDVRLKRARWARVDGKYVGIERLLAKEANA